jgi:TetR/AcrR family transcriptional regulator, mexJK operon transcriptional repressor
MWQGMLLKQVRMAVRSLPSYEELRHQESAAVETFLRAYAIPAADRAPPLGRDMTSRG